jgi:hypothetical protein
MHLFRPFRKDIFVATLLGATVLYAGQEAFYAPFVAGLVVVLLTLVRWGYAKTVPKAMVVFGFLALCGVVEVCLAESMRAAMAAWQQDNPARGIGFVLFAAYFLFRGTALTTRYAQRHLFKSAD